MKAFFFLSFVVATVAAQSTNDCPAPMTCLEGEQVCGAGDVLWNGCNTPGWCEPTRITIFSPLDPTRDPWIECPFHCPVKCAETEMLCPGGLDANGCKMPNICVPIQDGTVDNWGNPCWNTCPIVCQEGEQLCGTGVNSWTGCKITGSCEPAMEPWNPECPKPCPVECAETEMRCSGGLDANGCLLPDMCFPYSQGTVNNDGDACQWTKCPVASCNEGEQLCGNQVDPWTGCMMPGECQPIMDPYSDNCPYNCPIICGRKEKECWGGVDANGCGMPNFCYPGEQECPFQDGRLYRISIANDLSKI